MPSQPMHSPCFVHSHLDKGASLTDSLRTKQNQTNATGDLEVSKSLQRNNGRQLNGQMYGVQYPESTSSDNSESVLGAVDEEDDFGGSLTRQLAETAVGVREMSKQLGEYSWLYDKGSASHFNNRRSSPGALKYSEHFNRNESQG
jgi:NAD+ kinase